MLFACSIGVTDNHQLMKLEPSTQVDSILRKRHFLLSLRVTQDALKRVNNNVSMHVFIYFNVDNDERMRVYLHKTSFPVDDDIIQEALKGCKRIF